MKPRSCITRRKSDRGWNASVKAYGSSESGRGCFREARREAQAGVQRGSLGWYEELLSSLWTLGPEIFLVFQFKWCRSRPDHIKVRPSPSSFLLSHICFGDYGL